RRDRRAAGRGGRAVRRVVGMRDAECVQREDRDQEEALAHRSLGKSLGDLEWFENVASEGRLCDAGAQEPECMCQYMRIPSTAGARAAERSSFQAAPASTKPASCAC